MNTHTVGAQTEFAQQLGFSRSCPVYHVMVTGSGFPMPLMVFTTFWKEDVTLDTLEAVELVLDLDFEEDVELDFDLDLEELELVLVLDVDFFLLARFSKVFSSSSCSTSPRSS